MASLNILEELRTKKEVKDYFKQLGKEITEGELDALKQSYNKVHENNRALTLDQLSYVAGGEGSVLLMTSALAGRGMNFNGDFNVHEVKIGVLNEAGFRCFFHSDINHLGDPKTNGKFGLYFTVPDKDGNKNRICVNPDELKELSPELAEVLNSINSETAVAIEKIPEKPIFTKVEDAVAVENIIAFIKNGFNPEGNPAYIPPIAFNESNRAKLISALNPETCLKYVETKLDRMAAEVHLQCLGNFG